MLKDWICIETGSTVWVQDTRNQLDGNVRKLLLLPVVWAISGRSACVAHAYDRWSTQNARLIRDGPANVPWNCERP